MTAPPALPPKAIGAPMTCDLAPGCSFAGDWPAWLAHAPAHDLPHPDDRAAWLKARRTFLGASEIAAVCGLSSRGTALDVYADKVSATPKVDTPHMQRGRRFEPLILAAYAERHGVALERPATRRHPQHSWLAATPDATVTGEGRLVQVKTINARVARQWADGPPPHVVLQVWQEMAIFGVEVADVVVLDGTDLLEHEFELRFDPDAYSSAVEIAGRFWHESIVARAVPVDFDGTPSSETLRRLFPRSSAGALRDATEDEEDLALQYAAARDAVAAAKGLQDHMAARLKATIGDHEGITSGAVKATWRNKAGSVDTNALLQHLLGRLPMAEAESLRRQYTPTTGPRSLMVAVKEPTK